MLGYKMVKEFCQYFNLFDTIPERDRQTEIDRSDLQRCMHTLDWCSDRQSSYHSLVLTLLVTQQRYMKSHNMTQFVILRSSETRV